MLEVPGKFILQPIHWILITWLILINFNLPPYSSQHRDLRMDESVMEVPQNAAQPEHVAEPNSPAVDDFQEECL